MKIWRPYTQEQTASPPLPVQSAQGAHLHLADGRKIFDGISSWWLITHGHAQPEIVKAIQAQAEKLEQVVFANFTHAPAQNLAIELTKILPASLSHMFFSDNGSTAVEVAMKMAYQMQAQAGHKGRNKFLAFEHSYHGDTCGAMSVSGATVYNENYKGLLLEVLRCPQSSDPNSPLSHWIGPFLEIIKNRRSEICAVILEPLIQGAGGMIFWPKEAVRKLADVCRDEKIPLIFDEVMTGFGRTGSLFAFEQVDVVPDFLCLSKGLTGGFLPMSLTITSEEVYNRFLSEQPGKMLFHGHSFTGNALSCAAALANVQLWQNAGTRSRLDYVSKAQQKALQNHPTTLPIKNLRVCGTVAALDVICKDGYGGAFSREMHRLCLADNLFIRTLGSTVYLMPPYCSTSEEIERAWTIVFENISKSLKFIN